VTPFLSLKSRTLDSQRRDFSRIRAVSSLEGEDHCAFQHSQALSPHSKHKPKPVAKQSNYPSTPPCLPHPGRTVAACSSRVSTSTSPPSPRKSSRRSLPPTKPPLLKRGRRPPGPLPPQQKPARQRVWLHLEEDGYVPTRQSHPPSFLAQERHPVLTSKSTDIDLLANETLAHSPPRHLKTACLAA
jgi:hypothetical protein